jgi:hydrogenase expression/formation protein HypE
MDKKAVLDSHVSLAHGNGGRYMRELIEGVFARHLANDALDVHADAVPLILEEGEVVFTTDGFTVQPLEFPGGDIGSLAVHGTTNDLAVAGAVPKYLSLNAFIEEGMEMEVLDRLIASLAAAAKAIGVKVVAGDTKVLPRGEGGGLYLATTGIGIRTGRAMDMKNIQHGDALVVSGPVGDHGTAVMLAREAFGLRGDIRSDAASVLALTQTAMQFAGLRFMRDPTRGGLATVCTEISRATNAGVILQQSAIPIRDAVISVCEMLGYDPMYLACEGRVVAVIDSAQAEALVKSWQSSGQGAESSVIGWIDSEQRQVILQTPIGGERILEELEDDPLPRIC